MNVSKYTRNRKLVTLHIIIMITMDKLVVESDLPNKRSFQSQTITIELFQRLCEDWLMSHQVIKFSGSFIYLSKAIMLWLTGHLWDIIWWISQKCTNMRDSVIIYDSFLWWIVPSGNNSSSSWLSPKKLTAFDSYPLNTIIVSKEFY